MLESTVQKSKSRKIKVIALVAALVVALIAWLICQFAVGKDNLGFAPAWMLPIVLFLGAGLFNFVYGLIKKTAIEISFGGVVAVVGLAILLICLKIEWWIALVIALVLILAIFFSMFLIKSTTIEQSMEFDNAADAGRKSYADRKAETEARKEEERKAEQEQGLPEIKSFKE